MDLLEHLKKEYASLSEAENFGGLRDNLLDGTMNAAPELLAINIRRFRVDFNGTNFIGHKNTRKVNLPNVSASDTICQFFVDSGSYVAVIYQRINWCDLVLGGDAHPHGYRLRFVIVHDGMNLNRGHFRAYVRDFSSTSNNWFSIDNDKVMAVQIHLKDYVNTFVGATIAVYHKSLYSGYQQCVTEDRILRSEFVYGIYFGFVMVPFHHFTYILDNRVFASAT